MGSLRPATSPRKQTRTRSGCLNCRRKKRKCDEVRPTCGRCRHRCQVCEWGLLLSFRRENAQGLDRDHPSMRALDKRAQPRLVREFRIRNVTAEVIRDYHEGDVEDVEDAEDGGDNDEDNDEGENGKEDGHASSGPSVDPYLSDVGQARGTATVIDSLYLGPGSQLPMITRGLVAETVANYVNTTNTAHTAETMADYTYSELTGTPDGAVSEDGIFRPGTAYHELQSTLRSHLIQEVRSHAPTRTVTPRPDEHDGQERQERRRQELETLAESTSASLVDSELAATPTLATSASALSLSEPLLLLAGSDECELWRNWFDEVASWLDKFDRDRHFQTTLPIMARDHAYLRWSILALSARQRELKQTTRPAGRRQPIEGPEDPIRDHVLDRSLALYQEAIHQLLPHLSSRSTAVIAACVVLCMLEMLSSSPRDWRRHLDGCASLMQAVGMHGFVGGTEQAVFWCFARMDVCCGLISSVPTMIPVCSWTGRRGRRADGEVVDAAVSADGDKAKDDIDADIDADVVLFQAITASGGFEHWANYAVYLVARVMDLVALEPAAVDGHTASMPVSMSRASVSLHALPPWQLGSTAFRARWLQLWRHVCDWYRDRPPALHAAMTVSSAAASPFPTILFSNPAGISGTQLYHTASILLLQNQPAALRLSMPGRARPRGILWHARQICGIAISNDHHGAWTNAIQPLWIAGRYMSHPSEHRAILALLERIETESGWGTRTRADDLREYWGDLGD